MINSSSVANDIYLRFYIGATYYNSNYIDDLPAGGAVNWSQVNYIAEAGERLVVYGSNAGFIAYAKVVEFGTDILLRSYKNVSITSGNNTIYTASNNVVGMCLTGNLDNDGTASLVYYVNAMSGSVMTQLFLVKSGNVVSQNFATMASASVASLTRTTMISNFSVTSGDYISFYCSTGATPQIAWINIMEI